MVDVVVFVNGKAISRVSTYAPIRLHSTWVNVVRGMSLTIQAFCLVFELGSDVDSLFEFSATLLTIPMECECI